MGANRIELVREVDSVRQRMTIDIFDYDGWKVRVSAYDGISPMPSIFELLPAGKSAKDSAPLCDATVAKYRAEGWNETLSEEATARVEARLAAARAAERAIEEDLARRLAAFPVTKQDRVLAAAIAKPASVKKLDLRARGDEQLTVIPASVKQLVALEVLHADGNALPELPEELRACKELRELHLANNALVDLPSQLQGLKRLELLDLRSNRLSRVNVRPKVPMRLELGDNPLEPAVQDKLTRSVIGDLRKIRHLGIDTDCVFPIDLTFFEADYRKVKALPTEAIVLYGRAPSDEERATLAKLLPKARIEHRPHV